MVQPPPHPRGGGAPASHHRDHRWCTLDAARRVITTLLVSLLILSAISFIAWLALHPHNPTFRVLSFRVTNSTRPFSSSSRFYLELNVTNPNRKIDIVLERVEIRLLYGRASILRAVEEDVELRRWSHTAVSTELLMGSELRDDEENKRVFEEIVRDVAGNNGVVNFLLKMRVSAELKAGEWPSKDRSMEVLCGDIKVRFSLLTTGELMNGTTDCKVYTV